MRQNSTSVRRKSGFVCLTIETHNLFVGDWPGIDDHQLTKENRKMNQPQTEPDAIPDVPVEIDQQSVDTGGGAFIAGDAHAGGDVVGRDKIVNNVNNFIHQAVSAVADAEKAHALVLQRLAEGVRLYAQRLAAVAADETDTAAAGPYKGLLAYTLADAERFFGRDEAIASLLAQMERHRLTVLQAGSGAGKSSLLHAGIAPRLLAAGHLPVILRSYNRPPDQVIKQTFLPDLAQAPELREAPLRAFLRPVSEVLGSGTTLVLVLDQFEEFFTLLPDERVRAHFVGELADCVEDESLPVRWVLALRSEFFGDLATFRPRIRNPFHNDFRLNRLTRDEARAVIEKPAERYGIVYEPALVTRLLDDLSEEGEIHPPQIQLVCLALYQTLVERRQAAPDLPRTITEEIYETEGKAAGILRGHLNRVLHRSLPTRQARDLARRLLVELVSSDQRRIRRTRSDLAAALATGIIAAQTLDDVLDELVENRLLNVEVDEQNDDRSYEIAHDYLLGEVQVDPEVQAQKAAQELLEQEAETYRRYGTLLDRDKYEIINSQRAFLRLDGTAAELLEKSQDRVEAEKRERERQQRERIEIAERLAEEQAGAAESLRRLVRYSAGIFIAALITAFVVGGVTNLLVLPMVTDSAPLGLTSLQLSWNSENARRILESWSAQMRVAVGAAVGLSFLHIFAYPTALAFTCLLARHVFQLSSWSLARYGRQLAQAQMAVLALELVKTLSLLMMIAQAPDAPWPQLATISATLKYPLVVAGVAYSLLGLVLWIRAGFPKVPLPSLL